MANEQAIEWDRVIVHGIFGFVVGGVLGLTLGWFLLTDVWWVPAVVLGLIVGIVSAVCGDRFWESGWLSIFHWW